VFAVMTPEQFAHVNVGTTPAHPNAMCIAETVAVVAGEPHAREFVRRLQNQGKAVQRNECSSLCCTCLTPDPAEPWQHSASLLRSGRLEDHVTACSNFSISLMLCTAISGICA
jgi:hypothetical protein